MAEANEQADTDETTERRMDRELLVIQRIIRQLGELGTDDQRRVVAYLASRYATVKER